VSINNSQLKWIVADADRNPPDSKDPEFQIASLTAENRTVWATARSECFSFGTNKTSLNMIESAIFVLVLEHEQPESTRYCNTQHNELTGTQN